MINQILENLQQKSKIKMNKAGNHDPFSQGFNAYFPIFRVHAWFLPSDDQYDLWKKWNISNISHVCLKIDDKPSHELISEKEQHNLAYT